MWQQYLNLLAWLLLNPDKTKLVRFRPHFTSVNNGFNVSIDGKQIQETHSVKYLGITLQSSLTWDVHMQDLKSKIAPAIGMLYKLKYKLDAKTKLMIYQCLIHSHLNYMAVIYAYNKNSNSLKHLQSMQNKALKIVYKLPINFSTILLYKNVCKTVLPIYGLHEQNTLCCVFKCLNNIGYNTIPFMQNQANFSTRNRNNLRVAFCRLERTKQRIDHAGSFTYNNLPDNLKSCTGFLNFKHSCKNYLHDHVEMLLM